MLWACVLLPHLALDAVLRQRPDPERPLVLVAGTPPRALVLALNPPAARCGIQRGQSLQAAEARCPDLVVVDDNPGRTTRWRDFLAAVAYRYSSEVSTVLPDAIVFEASKSFAALGPWPVMASKLREELAALGFRHRLALAPTASAARVLADHHDGTAVCSQKELHRALAAVPVERACLADGAAELLVRVGLRTLGEVFAVPRASLGRRFGVPCLEHLAQLVGEMAETLPRYQPPDRFKTGIEFDQAIAQTQGLLFPLRHLVSDFAAFLAGRDQGVQRFVLRLAHEGHAVTELPVGLLATERDAARLFECAKLRLERSSLPAPVRALELRAEELPAFVPAGLGLFEQRSTEALDWLQLRERLRARLGDEAVYSLLPVADHRPERGWRRVAATDHEPETGEPALHPRPAWLLPRPTPWHGGTLQVLAGPERIESGWWDGGDVVRDYYVVETPTGQRAWAYTKRDTRDHFVIHGWFA